MRYIRRHDDHLAGFEGMVLPGDGHHQRSLEQMDKRIEGRAVLGQSLTAVEGEGRDVAAR